MTLDVSRVRAAYPAISDGFAYLDGAAGTQVPTPVIEAISDAYRAGLGNLGGAFPASARSDEIVEQCRRAVADLTGAHPDGVVLGPNMTSLTYRMAAALSASWGKADEVVVSRLDHDANVRPWVQAASRASATVRWADVDLPSLEMPLEQFDAIVSERTRLVALTAASNIVGTRPDVSAVAEIAHRHGALLFVDGVHATPHVPVDIASLGADFYVTSAYKWSGPHVGTIVASPQLLEQIWPDKLAASSDSVPERFELGTLPFADLAGVAAAVDHLASLGGEQSASGSRRSRVLASMAAVEEYEAALFDRMIDGLSSMEHVTLYGSAKRRAPTAYFNLKGHTPAEVAAHLARARVNVWNGDNYAWELTGRIGIRSDGGAVRAGIVHYNDGPDVDRLLEAVAGLA
jgi:cysteine desulfurase family protein (TIGR01976 family)